MSSAVFECGRLAREARPADLDAARRLARSLFEARGMDKSDSSGELIEVVARRAVERRPVSDAAQALRQVCSNVLKRFRDVDEPGWLDPPRFAKRIDFPAAGELLVYPRVLIGLARPVFDRIVRELPVQEGELEPLGAVGRREFRTWLSIDPFAASTKIGVNNTGEMMVSVNIGNEVVGYVYEADVDRLTQRGARHLPVFGTSIVVGGVLIGSDAESAKLALRFPVPNASS